MDSVIVAAASLEARVAEICRAAGSRPGEASAVARELVEANLRGHDSHGVGMLPAYIGSVRDGTLKPNTHARVVRETPAIVVIDGGLGYGQVIGAEAMALGVDKARVAGAAVVALRDSHHLGRIGAWAELCASAGMASMHYVNVVSVPARVAPFGGTDARFGTNPFCAGVPIAGADPIILDMATSRIAVGKVRVARNLGKQVPEGCLIDSRGRPTRDPGALLSEPRGALLPFGEHKGSGLALICELFAGALTGAGTFPGRVRTPEVITNSMLSVIVDPTALGDARAFKSEVERMIAWVKASPPAPGAEVLVAGEPERRFRAERLQGGIPIDAETWGEIAEAARSVGVAVTRPG